MYHFFPRPAAVHKRMHIPERERRTALTFLVAHAVELNVAGLFTCNTRGHKKPRRKQCVPAADKKVLKQQKRKVPKKSKAMSAKVPKSTRRKVVVKQRTKKLPAVNKTKPTNTTTPATRALKKDAKLIKRNSNEKKEVTEAQPIPTAAVPLRPEAAILTASGRLIETFHNAREGSVVTLGALEERLERKWGYIVSRQRLIRVSDGAEVPLPHSNPLVSRDEVFFPGAFGVYLLTRQPIVEEDGSSS